jgi:hypothetical protein
MQAAGADHRLLGVAVSARNLPEDGELQLGPVRLPAGRRIAAGLGSAGPVARATLGPVSDPGRIWQALSAISPDAGLVPFLLAGLDSTTRRPWDDDEFSDPADVGGLGAAELVAELWSGEFEEEDDETGDGRWTGTTGKTTTTRSSGR